MNHGILPLIDWGEGQNLTYSDLSIFPSQIAITFWEKSRKAIVVDNYTNALNVVPIANIKNIPILIQGETTKEALYRLGTIYPK